MVYIEKRIQLNDYHYRGVMHSTQNEAELYLQDKLDTVMRLTQNNIRPLFFSTFSTANYDRIKPMLSNKPFSINDSDEGELSPAEAFAFQVLGDEMFYLSKNIRRQVMIDEEIRKRIIKSCNPKQKPPALLDFTVGMYSFGTRLVHAARSRKMQENKPRYYREDSDEYLESFNLTSKKIKGPVLQKAFELADNEIVNMERLDKKSDPRLGESSREQKEASNASMRDGIAFAFSLYSQAFNLGDQNGLRGTVPPSGLRGITERLVQKMHEKN